MRNRLIITGTAGSGKSSLLSCLSTVEPVVSNIYENAPHLAPSGTDAVMIDYGELVLDSDRKLELYATPGQRRFQFMWKALGKRAAGLVIMIDHRRPNPLSDIVMYLENFQEIISTNFMIIGLNYFDVPGGPELEEYQYLLHSFGVDIPVICMDARNQKDGSYCLTTLLHKMMISKKIK